MSGYTIAYTVLGCCQLGDVNPVAYLADVLPRLAQRVRLRDIPALRSLPAGKLRVLLASAHLGSVSLLQCSALTEPTGRFP